MSLELSIVSLIRIQAYSFDSVGDTVLTVMAYALIALLLSFIVGSEWFLRSNHSEIREVLFENRYGALVTDLKHHHISAMSFPSVFMAYRLLYALNIVFLQKRNYFQIQSLVFTQSLVVIF